LSKAMGYREALKYLYSFLNYEVKTDYAYPRDLNLRRMLFLMKLFGAPQRKLPFVLVAGTKGKGSTACFLSSILLRGGYKTGLYTSPHLHDPRERILISGRKVSKKDFAGLLNKIKKKISRYPLPAGLGKITFFELLTTAAFICFAERKVDIAVLEVGLGGRLDATNIVTPLVSIITPISYDHQDKLGGTLTEIADEKMRIVKKKGFFVSAVQPPAVHRLFEKWAKRQRAKSFFGGKDFKPENREVSADGSRFDFFNAEGKLNHLWIRMPGHFQVENAACAIQAACILQTNFGFKLGEKNIRSGLKSACWPGRFQIICRDPFVVLDGAHNGASFQALRQSVRDLFGERKITMIFGLSKDKDLPRILPELSRFSLKRIIVTQAKNPRAFPAEDLFVKVRGEMPSAEHSPELKESLQSAFCQRTKDDIFLITGSFFLVAEAETLLKASKSLAEVR